MGHLVTDDGSHFLFVVFSTKKKKKLFASKGGFEILLNFQGYKGHFTPSTI
jgi:hypothetical protein